MAGDAGQLPGIVIQAVMLTFGTLAALLAAYGEHAAGETFNVTDGLDVTWREFTDGLASGLGCAPARWSLPYWAAQAIGLPAYVPPNPPGSAACP